MGLAAQVLLEAPADLSRRALRQQDHLQLGAGVGARLQEFGYFLV
ncbi:MAG: hypothetical protein OXD50_01065 [Chloroflexi bacterium]|nr:hypothetical protein [Chloroflexota bacterium]